MLKTKHLIMGLLLLTSSMARAETPDDEEAEKYSRDLTVLTLAQQCVGEVDFENPSECWVMWHINAALAEKKAHRDPTWHLVDQLRAYNSAFKVVTSRTVWVLELNLESVEPPHWSRHAPSWHRLEPRWRQIVKLAEQFLDDPGRRPRCGANAYGGSCLDPKGACDHAPECWVQVICHSDRKKPFAQAYYVAKRCRS